MQGLGLEAFRTLMLERRNPGRTGVRKNGGASHDVSKL